MDIIGKDTAACETRRSENQHLTVSRQGIFEGDELVYGIYTQISAGRNFDIIHVKQGDFKNNRYTTRTTNDISIPDGIVYTDGDRVVTCDEYNGYSFLYNEDFTYIYRLFKNVERIGNIENRYLPENGLMYLSYDVSTAAGDDHGDFTSFYGTLYKDGTAVYTGTIEQLDLPANFGNDISGQPGAYSSYYGPASDEHFYIMWAEGYTDPDGIIYYMREKNYTRTIADNVYYRGNVVNGVPHGHGMAYHTYKYRPASGAVTYTDSGVVWGGNSTESGLMYIGGFSSGRFSGSGSVYTYTGNLYLTGTWVDGKREGYGEIYHNAGINDDNTRILQLVYKGNFSGNQRNGYGVAYAPLGNLIYSGLFASFEGEWVNDNRANGKSYSVGYDAESNTNFAYLSYEGDFLYDLNAPDTVLYGTEYDEQGNVINSGAHMHLEW